MKLDFVFWIDPPTGKWKTMCNDPLKEELTEERIYRGAR